MGIKMKVNLLVVLVSITAFYFGIKVILEPIWYSSKYLHKIDVSGFHWPLGLGFILFGIILLYIEYKRIKELDKDNFK